MKKFLAILAFSILTLLAGSGFAAVRWRVLESEHFRLVYPEGYEDMARHAVSWIETERENVNTLTGWDPGKVWVVIEDVGMGVNGFANPVGNEVHLFTTPPFGYDLSTRDWIRTVGVHEYTHISSIQPVYGFPRFLKFLLGPWVLPNALVPGWMIEGVTVYYESQVEPYEGRLEGGFFDANLLTRASQGMFPRTWEMNGSLTQFPLGNSIYAYGGPFFEWLVNTKGPETVSQFYRCNGRNIPFFFIDRSASKSFGDRFPTLLHDWRQSVTDQVSSWSPADSSAHRLTDKGWYVSGLTTDRERIFYTRTTIAKRAALNTSWYIDVVALDPSTGEEEVILRPNTSVQMLRVHEGVLYYATTTFKRGFSNTSNNAFGELYQLRSYDLSTGRSKSLYTGRIRAFDQLPDGSFLLSIDRTPGFGSALLRIPPRGGEPEKLWEGDTLVGEIVISEDGSIFFSAREQGENWDLWRYSADNRSWEQLTRTDHSEFSLWLDQEGNLLYAANPKGPQGRVGVYVLDTETMTHQVFDAPSYALNPVLIGEELFFLGLNPQGYDIYSVPARLSLADMPSRPPLSRGPTFWDKRLPTYSGGFKTRSRLRPYLSLLRPWARIPYIWPTFDSIWNLTNLDMGVFLLGADVLGENSYQADISYDAVTNTNTVDFAWSNQRFAPLSLNLDYSHNPMWDTAGQFLGYGYRIYPSFNYPIYYRPGRGLNVIRWGEGFLVTGDSLQNRFLVSNISLSFSWPFWGLGLAASHQWESPIFSPDERSWLLTRAAAVFDLAGGLLLADVSTFADLSAQLPAGYNHPAPIRGYAEIETTDPVFATTTLEYRHRLLVMRFGVWNPNIFFEDLYAHVFVDAALDSRELLGASVGLELSPEIHLFWGFLRLAPIFGVSVNIDRKIKPHFGVWTALPISLMNPRKDAVEFAADPWPDSWKDMELVETR